VKNVSEEKKRQLKGLLKKKKLANSKEKKMQNFAESANFWKI